MKKTTIALALSALVAGSAGAATDMQELHKELEIMQSIMQTALEQNSKDEKLKVRDLDATYLDGYGVVFEIAAAGGNRIFRFNFGELFEGLAPNPPMPPSPGGENGDFEINLDFDEQTIEENIEYAMEQASEVWQQVAEKTQRLKSEVRELAWEMRENERRLTDLRFEKRHADEQRLKEIEQQSAELRKELRELEQKKEKLTASAEKMEQEKRQQIALKRQARQQQYKSFLARFEDTLADTLCKYGSGLKSLPEDESVSVVLKDFVQQDERGDRQDKIYIFRQQDITACVTGRLDKDTLLGKVNTYQF
ncbi:hypothetical protein [Lacimicrobium alkaliphilum]|uniref:Uncharacterized protein n=1 Tax=Lacimicrobium alkaliphilum TaxID=1526571 RepID=A0ABQ1RGT5_9ALTE|nr:hypothetical protein [Lacimicrobium alkaliphilum]GGD66076.1 hypothetical protein GCM10011357_21650 [Lacimicrobium alkaliphilum]